MLRQGGKQRYYGFNGACGSFLVCNASGKNPPRALTFGDLKHNDPRTGTLENPRIGSIARRQVHQDSNVDSQGLSTDRHSPVADHILIGQPDVGRGCTPSNLSRCEMGVNPASECGGKSAERAQSVLPVKLTITLGLTR